MTKARVCFTGILFVFSECGGGGTARVSSSFCRDFVLFVGSKIHCKIWKN